ncbi:hypothetical protein Rta_12590 [Ramlibacter tataouinensis TTB310]|uniref:Uncharacterized protein n=1 Tax=Ramlibacter tataouinensis (strain ATCC BAA-407 / DSM 14655 / LMG 21543 / TTB310) TaxID=365046 RepID=F5Y2I3_RAMTT|nr:hypothetical protein Rta_12590 [Ramlibacter tataouinensis TTB310]
MSGFAWYLHSRTAQTLERAARLARPVALAGMQQERSKPGLHSSLPQAAQHTRDYEELFRLAKETGLRIDSVQYHRERNPALALQLRTLDIRVSEEYPKLKRFLAAVLGKIPHASLQELRFERSDGTTLQGEIAFKLVLLYRDDLPPSGLARL